MRVLSPGLLLLLAACGGAEMEPWHNEHLDQEFVAAEADAAATFEDYLALEDRLFRQLESEVYARVPTGPAFGLVRYSAGSAADPTAEPVDWNRTFELQAADPVGGVLLLHGMSDSPYSLRSLGEALNERGYWVIGLRLPGHGTAPSGLLRLRWEDMAAAVAIAMTHLAERAAGKPLHMVGYSNGAPLALNFTLDALEDESLAMPASLVLISPAIGLTRGAGLASWLRTLSHLPGLGHLAWLTVQPEFDPYKYNSFAVNAGAVVFALTQRVSRRISALSPEQDRQMPPILAFKSTVDATVATSAVVDSLLRPVDSDRNELVLFDINRLARGATVLVDDPAPLTERLLQEDGLPFTVTFIANRDPETHAVVARRKPPRSAGFAEIRDLEMAWPREVLSLSHVALPFEPDDPLYGRGPPSASQDLFLGQQAIQGERGLLRIPADVFVRLRHNPFYPYLERRSFDWMEAAATR